jgi:hypothetical protein
MIQLITLYAESNQLKPRPYDHPCVLLPVRNADHDFVDYLIFTTLTVAATVNRGALGCVRVRERGPDLSVIISAGVKLGRGQPYNQIANHPGSLHGW